METNELKTLLLSAHEQLWNSAAAMNPAMQIMEPNGKWSALQHVQHINKGVAAVYKYMGLDKNMIEQSFGLAEKPSRSFDECMDFFGKDAIGAVSTERFNPEASTQIVFTDEYQKGKHVLKGLIDSMAQWTEQDLDKYNCPHPRLGKLTAREMLYFTLFHANYHRTKVGNIAA